MISIALTKKVQTKGNIRVRYSNLKAIAAIKAAVEMKKRTQYSPVYFAVGFLVCSMYKKFARK
jgi:hypothetical protein